jgi:hypothetical protein
VVESFPQLHSHPDAGAEVIIRSIRTELAIAMDKAGVVFHPKWHTR